MKKKTLIYFTSLMNLHKELKNLLKELLSDTFLFLNSSFPCHQNKHVSPIHCQVPWRGFWPLHMLVPVEASWL